DVRAGGGDQVVVGGDERLDLGDDLVLVGPRRPDGQADGVGAVGLALERDRQAGQRVGDRVGLPLVGRAVDRDLRVEAGDVLGLGADAAAGDREAALVAG